MYPVYPKIPPLNRNTKEVLIHAASLHLISLILLMPLRCFHQTEGHDKFIMWMVLITNFRHFWWQINSSDIMRLFCMMSTLSLPVYGNVMSGDMASIVVPAGKPKLAHYLPSFGPSHFATLGLCVCVCIVFTPLSSSYRQLRDVSMESLPHWSLWHNWTISSLFFIPMCAYMCELNEAQWGAWRNRKCHTINRF